MTDEPLRITEAPLAAFLAAWHGADTGPVPAPRLMPIAVAAGLRFHGYGRLSDTTRLGLLLSKMRGRELRTTEGRYRVEGAGIYCGRQRWRIELLPSLTLNKNQGDNHE